MPLLFLLKKFKIFSVVLKDELDAELHVGFCALHHVVDVCEGKFGFDHPELSDMPARVRDLCPESWSEGVDVGKGTAVVFDSKLS